MTLELDEPARVFLAKNSMDGGDGARNVARAIARFVATPLSAAILRGDIRSGNVARVKYDGHSITVNAA
jgi:ATP-dependent Clp protease ATP-binding subunit ClpA